MKVLLTGSAGRIGTLIAEKLLNQGNSLVGVDLAPGKIQHAHYQHHQCRFDSAQQLLAAVSGCDIVLHIGAMMSWHPKDNDAMFHANVSATQMLLEAAKLAGVRRFVFASSGEVYPEVRAQQLPVTESHPCNPISFYGLTKKLGEELVLFYQSQGLETVILRFPHTQSVLEILDSDSVFSGPRFFLDAKIRQMAFFGNQKMVERLSALQAKQTGPAMILQYGEEDDLPYRMHIADARDTAAGVLLALDHPAAANEIFNLGPDDVVEFERVLPLMAELTGLPLVKASMPGKAVRFTTSNEKIKRLLGYQPQHQFISMIREAAAQKSAS